MAGRVGVQEGDDLAVALAGAGIAGDRQAGMRHRQHVEGEASGDIQGLVRRPIVDDDDLELGVVHLHQRVEADLEVARLVVGAHDDRHPRPVLAHSPERALGPGAGCGGGYARTASRVGEAESPGGDLLAADDPVVGPGEDKSASHTGFVDDIELHLEGAGLVSLVSLVSLVRLAAVIGGGRGRQLDPELAHQQGEVADGNGKMPQVALQRRGVGQKHVGGDQVELGNLQVLGARVRPVTDEQAVVRRVQLVDQPAQRALDSDCSMQSDQVGGYLVADADREHLRPAGQPLGRLLDGGEPGGKHRAVDPASGARHGAPVVVVQSRVHDEPHLGGGVEQVDRRQRVRADRVEAEGGHRGEVTAQLARLGELGTVRPRGEPAVGHAPGTERAAVA